MRIEAWIRGSLPEGSDTGICVYDLTAGCPLYAYHADRLSRPASTMKLLTAITALSLPGADEPFRTEVWYRGSIEQDTLRGDVYVVGGFDPEFTEACLDTLVSRVAAFPFSVIQGTVYGDVSMKDSLYWGSGWMWDDAPYSFQPCLSPLMLDKGVVTVTALPASQKGEEATLSCRPRSSYYKLHNLTQSRTPAAGRFSVTRQWMEQKDEVVATGNVSGPCSTSLTIHRVADMFMHTFVERLREQGIQLGGDSLSAPPYSFGTLPHDSLGVRMAVVETPLQQVLHGIMKKSDNLNAEALFCRMGTQAAGRGHASADDGLLPVRRLISELGYSPDKYGLADGCGLSHYNYVSPELLVAFLKYAYTDTGIFQKLYKALPISGVDGTLKNRMKQGTAAYKRVHAKTGSFTGINCLAGYLTSANGHLLAFAIMNQNVLSARAARLFQDGVCHELVKHAGSASTLRGE